MDETMADSDSPIDWLNRKRARYKNDGTESEPTDDLGLEDFERAANETPRKELLDLIPHPNIASTPPPPGGFPQIHSWDPLIVFENIHNDYCQFWTAIPELKIFVYVWNAGFQTRDQTTQVDLLQQTIKKLLDSYDHVVAPPRPAMEMTGKKATPWVYLVAQLTNEAAEQLLSQTCWSTPSITFFAIPFTPPISDYIFTIENLTFCEQDTD